MPTPNIPQVQTANTFDFWRIQTNNLINVANELRSTTYEKEAGLLFLSNTAIGTALQVSGNARVDTILTVGTLLATTANISGNLTAANATITDTLTASRANITGNLSAGNVSVSGALTVGGTNIAAAIASAANTVTVSVNGTNALSKKKINFIDSASVTFSVVAGSGDNADITLTAAGGGGGGSGAQGVQGVQGATGATGAAGTQGATGATGSTGSPGAQGSTGSPGAQGATGPSTAVNATNDLSNNPLYPVMVGIDGSNQVPKISKTKLSFNANDGILSATKFSGDGSSLTGIIGTPGAQGHQGRQGFQGVQGSTGSPGAQGSTGSPGVQGTAGTPSGLSTDLTVRSLGVGVAASGVQGEIRATSDITAYYSSDVRLKENIRKIENALELISMIEGVRYDWTDEYIEKRGGIDDYFVRKEDIGVIAQDLQKVLPEVVAERPDGYLAVRYEKIVALLLAALKELKKEVDDIKKRL